MREILFRGKRQDNGEWIEGCLLRVYERVCRGVYQPREYAIQFVEEWIAPPFVVAETVGQFTGLADKNGKKIFEGDIVKTCRNNIGKVEFGQYWDEEIEADFYGYAWIGKDEYGESVTLSLNKCWNGHEVIGTIYDNPELLEEQTNAD